MPQKKQYSSIIARLLGARHFLLFDLPEITASLDTGYGRKETIDIVRRMYKGKGVNLNTQQFSILLFEWIEQKDEAEAEDFLDGTLSFSGNWNVNGLTGKLNCKRWTTIRMRNDKKYIENGLFRVEWKNKLTEAVAEYEKSVLELRHTIEGLKKALEESKNLFTQ